MSSYLMPLGPSFIQLLKVTRVFIDWILDVHNALAKFFPTTTYSFEFIRSIDSSITSIIIPNWTCNDIDYTIFDFSRFSIVESIEIGNDCFESVKTFQIEGLNRLKTIKIGINSFTQEKNDYRKWLIEIIPHIELWIIGIHSNWWIQFQWFCWWIWIEESTSITIHTIWFMQFLS